MRTPELDATFVLSRILVKKTQDSGGDEPYLWVVGFKVDADTLRSGANPLIPTVEVHTFAGGPHFPNIRGSGSIGAGPHPVPIPAALGTRTFRLRPAFLDGTGWFDGFGGIVCLLWDQDEYAPRTSEEGRKEFERLVGTALTDLLNLLLHGDPGFDAALTTDAQGNLLPQPAGGLGLTARMRRLADPVGAANVARELAVRLKSSLLAPIEAAMETEADVDESFDDDDSLGVQAALFTTGQLQSLQPISLRFMDAGADYEVTGFASGDRVHRHSFISSVHSVQRQLVEMTPVDAKVCWFAPKTYQAMTFRQTTTTRFIVTNLSGTPVEQVRWLLDGRPLDGPSGTVGVTLEPAASMYRPPVVSVAAKYPGGGGTLAYTIEGPIMDLTNTAGDGVFHGTVQAVVRYEGDPPLDGHMDGPTLLERGYRLTTAFSVVTLEVLMGDDYRWDVQRCLGMVQDIDRKRIPVNWGRVKIIPGDPPPTWDSLQEVIRQEFLITQSLARHMPDETVGPDTDGARSPAERLRGLQALREEGLISADELKAVRARIIAQL
ncbi:hypothetical protein [Zafaria cholistanensis]|nr:hypothetical protein [Zafaria cholistanensis]